MRLLTIDEVQAVSGGGKTSYDFKYKFKASSKSSGSGSGKSKSSTKIECKIKIKGDISALPPGLPMNCGCHVLV